MVVAGTGIAPPVTEAVAEATALVTEAVEQEEAIPAAMGAVCRR